MRPFMRSKWRIPLCQADPAARVLIVCTELCTLHFQQQPTTDNITSSLLFGDGSAAVLVTGEEDRSTGFPLLGFYGEVMPKGKQDMSWELSSTGFTMTLSGYVPALIEEDFEKLVNRALAKQGISRDDITHWSVHPGGKKISGGHRKKPFTFPKRNWMLPIGF